ncbi:FtsX-like permease family protein [Streptococcus orisasini]|uniref:FtsX-like permease family protein n=1 Tax=Streptococcus orisasini TaxID=1080071 RepID=UPI00070B0E1D|nr:FtsX-like permease family protein [Streptococcus orisasini]
MVKKTYWKDIWKSIRKSKSRFLSILLLLMLGSFALVGLKVTEPDMRQSAAEYLDKHNTMDLAVIANYGLSKDDQKELNQLKRAQVDYGRMTDVTIKKANSAVRVYSKADKISTYAINSGRLPQNSREIALDVTLRDDYKIGDRIAFTQSENALLKKDSYRIVGFVTSSEIWSKTYMGTSTAGDGSLSNYAVVTDGAFNSDTATIARIRYDDLKNLDPFSDAYTKKLMAHQDNLDRLLSDNGKKRLQTLQNSARARVSKSRQQVKAAKDQLTLQKGALSYLSGSQLATAQKAVAEAEKKIVKSEADIKKAETDIAAMSEPSYNSYNRSTLPGGGGYQTFSSSSANVSAIGNLFPVVLYLVAVLVTFTTMTRFVDEERTNSGVLKALGYSDKDVIQKFVIYGAAASLIGTVLGILAGHYVLAPIVSNSTTSSLTFNQMHYYFYWDYSLLALVISFLSAVLPAFLVAKRELTENPAQLLLPKPPAKGAKILLERLPFIWNRLSFTYKVTVRNIFRYKQRMLMTVFGVAGSVALLFAGLGIQSSLNKIIDHQFHQITPYNLLAAVNDKADEADKKALAKALQDQDIAKKLPVFYQQTNTEISGLADKQTVSLLAGSHDHFDGFINLKDIKSGKKLRLTDKGVIITELLAKYYHVQAGDKFTFKDENGKKIRLRVAAVAEMNVGHYLLMTDSYYQKKFGKIAKNNAYLINLKDTSSNNISAKARELLAMDGVLAVSQSLSVVKTVELVVKSLNGAMTVLVVTSVLLAVVILYNLTNINVAERIRELSTIKVLGFYDQEVTMYIYRETVSLSLIGILLGLLAGHYLHKIIMSMIGNDNIMFGNIIDGYIYAVPVFTVVFILLILGLLVNRRLKNLDMLEALKSVD